MKSWLVFGLMCGITAAPAFAQTASSVGEATTPASPASVATGSISDAGVPSVATSVAVTSPRLLAAPDTSALASACTPIGCRRRSRPAPSLRPPMLPFPPG